MHHINRLHLTSMVDRWQTYSLFHSECSAKHPYLYIHGECIDCASSSCNVYLGGQADWLWQHGLFFRRGRRHIVFDRGPRAGPDGQAVEGGREDLGHKADGQQAPAHADVVIQQAGLGPI